MKVLLDTNALIWTAYRNDCNANRINPVKNIILSIKNDIYVSTVSFWEIAIKLRIGKINVNLDELISATECYGFYKIPLLDTHARVLLSLPTFHKDPFDHMIISQAKYENMTIITGDEKFKKYLPETIVI